MCNLNYSYYTVDKNLYVTNHEVDHEPIFYSTIHECNLLETQLILQHRRRRHHHLQLISFYLPFVSLQQPWKPRTVLQQS